MFSVDFLNNYEDSAVMGQERAGKAKGVSFSLTEDLRKKLGDYLSEKGTATQSEVAREALRRFLDGKVSMEERDKLKLHVALEVADNLAWAAANYAEEREQENSGLIPPGDGTDDIDTVTYNVLVDQIARWLERFPKLTRDDLVEAQDAMPRAPIIRDLLARWDREERQREQMRQEAGDIKPTAHKKHLAASRAAAENSRRRASAGEV